MLAVKNAVRAKIEIAMRDRLESGDLRFARAQLPTHQNMASAARKVAGMVMARGYKLN